MREDSGLLRIYLVEDDTAIRESIRKNMDWEKCGYIFAGQATDGEMAYEEIKTIKPDVVLTDLKMPFMDGLELSRLIRKEMPDIKIIILTGYSDLDSVQEALRIGVNEYLLKPVTQDVLAQTLANVSALIALERKRT